MSIAESPAGCGTAEHWNRRTLLKAAGAAGLAWLTPLADRLARAAESAPRGDRPQSVIVLWLQGGPSQLETFDPHPGSEAAAGSTAIATAVRGIQLAAGFEQLAEQMKSVSIVRSVVSKEGDHERATYNMKTGFRPDTTLIHPSLGAVVAYQLPDDTEIPRHISILPGAWPARGGYLGDQFDAFKIGDPQGRIPDVTPQVDAERARQRVRGSAGSGRAGIRPRPATRTRIATRRCTACRCKRRWRMMSSEQLKAFDVSQESASHRRQYGDTPFGRGCLAAVRLIDAGVRCVEVTLDGWDSHADNHQHPGRPGGDPGCGLRRLDSRLEATRPVRQDRGDVWRRIWPHAAIESRSRPRSLAARLQRRAGRRRTCRGTSRRCDIAHPHPGKRQGT